LAETAVPPSGILEPNGGVGEIFLMRRLAAEFPGIIAAPWRPPFFRESTLLTQSPLVPPWHPSQPYVTKIGVTSFLNDTGVEAGGAVGSGPVPLSLQPDARTATRITANAHRVSIPIVDDIDQSFLSAPCDENRAAVAQPHGRPVDSGYFRSIIFLVSTIPPEVIRR
jgi:hypothetical protein